MLAVQPVVFADDPQLAEIPDRPARAGGEQAALLADRHAGRAGGAGGLHAAEESSNTRQRDGATPSLAAARR